MVQSLPPSSKKEKRKHLVRSATTIAHTPWQCIVLVTFYCCNTTPWPRDKWKCWLGYVLDGPRLWWQSKRYGGRNSWKFTSGSTKQEAENTVQIALVFWNLKAQPTPSDIYLPVTLCLLNFLRQIPYLGTKFSVIWAFGSHSHSNHHRVLKCLLCTNIKIWHLFH